MFSAWGINTAKRYLGYSLLGHVGWEVLQLPLYTIFWNAPPQETAFAVVHCTAGDMLIALITLLAALVIAGNGRWPAHRQAYLRVGALAVVLGMSYTVFSEWLNTVVLHTWAYTEAMPVLPVLEVGLTPLLQWLVVPTAAFIMSAPRSAHCPQRTTKGSAAAVDPGPQGKIR